MDGVFSGFPNGEDIDNANPMKTPLLLLVLWTFGVLGCAKRPPAVPEGFPVKSSQTRVIVTPGDVLRLSFKNVPELNQSQKVSRDGRLNLLQIGSVKAGGKSLDTLQSELAERYQLKDHGDLSLALDSSVIPVYVTGAVLSPGKVILDRPMTVLEAIMESGGFDRTSGNLAKVRLTRLVKGTYQTRILNMKGESIEPVDVQPYDMIEVPRFFY